MFPAPQRGCVHYDSSFSAASGLGESRVLRAVKALRILKIVRLLKLVKFFRQGLLFAWMTEEKISCLMRRDPATAKQMVVTANRCLTRWGPSHCQEFLLLIVSRFRFVSAFTSASESRGCFVSIFTSVSFISFLLLQMTLLLLRVRAPFSAALAT